MTILYVPANSDQWIDVALTSETLRRFESHKFLQPISVAMYQPLKAVPGKKMPPQSKAIFATAGNTYHRRPNSSNHGNLLWMRIEYEIDVGFALFGRNWIYAVKSIFTLDASMQPAWWSPTADRNSRDRVHWLTRPLAKYPNRFSCSSILVSCRPVAKRTDNWVTWIHLDENRTCAWRFCHQNLVSNDVPRWIQYCLDRQ